MGTPGFGNFDAVADKIHSVSWKHGATLVHCAAAVSRSAMLCIAYLMKFHSVCLLEAYNWDLSSP